MKSAFLLVSLAVLAVAGSANFPSWKDSQTIAQHAITIPVDISKLGGGTGGGSHCAGCTMVIHLLEQYSSIHSMAIDTFVEKHFCSLFKDEKIKSTCDEIEAVWGPKLIAVLADTVDPDEACRKLKLCTDPSCNLIPKSKQTVAITLSSEWESYAAKAVDDEDIFGGAIDWFKKLTNKVFTDHLPLTDVDGDRFSGSMEQLRGTHWRGKDCDDLDNKVYPGRKTNPFTKSDVDYNCNGIKGTNPETGKLYQEELCGESKPMGVAVFGDSAGAHFELPPQWFNASDWNSSTFDGVLGKLLDEIDLPYKSTYTGFAETSAEVPVRSIYKYLSERNQCNHRDYQNLGVNGGASRHFHNIQALARNQEDDQPLLMFLELVGNDVCNHHHGFDSMTTPTEFYDNIVKILKFLDTVVPAGSHLVTVGLADGRVLYETLHDRIHPLGVTYPDVYSYLNCLNVSPCWGWMNAEDSVREETYKVASSLNAQYPKIIAENTFKNFDIQYYPFPIREMIQKWEAAGKDPAKLIEPVDGFHPSQTANALFADWLWASIQNDHPDWIGEVNPNNETITKLFGDQGGY